MSADCRIPIGHVSLLTSWAGSGAKLTNASPDRDIERVAFGGEFILSFLGAAFGAHVALFISFRLAFRSHGDPFQLSFECHSVEEFFYSGETFVALYRKLEGLALEPLVPSVEEGDDQSWLTKMTPDGLDYVALPARLIWCRQRLVVEIAERRAPRRCGAIGLSLEGIGIHGLLHCCKRERARLSATGAYVCRAGSPCDMGTALENTRCERDWDFGAPLC